MTDYSSADPTVFENVDPAVSFEDQVESDYDGPVIMVGTYVVNSAAELDALIASWMPHVEFMRSQPGFLSAQMHRGIGGANVALNYAVWESLAAFRDAAKGEIQTPSDGTPTPVSYQDYPAAVGRRVLLKKIAVPGLCLA